MTFSIVHLSDPHFGNVADLQQIKAVEDLIPDLEPRVIVLSGDISTGCTWALSNCCVVTAAAFTAARSRSAQAMWPGWRMETSGRTRRAGGGPLL